MENNAAVFFESLVDSNRKYLIEFEDGSMDEAIFKDVYLYLTGLNVQYFSSQKNDLKNCLYSEIKKIAGKDLADCIENGLVKDDSKQMTMPSGLAELEEQKPKPVEAKRESISVHAFTLLVKKKLEVPSLQNIWVSGELTNVSLASSGHAYFSLKDEKAQVSCVMFKGHLRNHKFKLENGLKVEVYGQVSLYEKRGNYQLMLTRVIPEGMGELQLAFEQMKQKLQEEGLFDMDRKKRIPVFPTKVGVVTSPTGAAFRDILKTTQIQFPNVHIYLYPAMVQGEGAARKIADQINQANIHGEVDVLIVGRGGGSTEDLWAFNEEVLARAIADSVIPIISAVGHEVDFFISDFVADHRSATPTAAAEYVSIGKRELPKRLMMAEKRAALSMQQRMGRIRELLVRTDKDSLMVHIRNTHREAVQRMDQSTIDTERAFREKLRNVTQDFFQLATKMDALSPLKVLARGYSVVYDNKHNIVTDADQLSKGDEVEIQFHQGLQKAKILE